MGWGGKRTAGPGKRLGRPPDSDKLVPKTLRLRAAQWEALQTIAARAGLSVNALLAGLVQARIDDQ